VSYEHEKYEKSLGRSFGNEKPFNHPERVCSEGGEHLTIACILSTYFETMEDR